jgi:cbb3-type cytochrome oxidase subunit 3
VKLSDIVGNAGLAVYAEIALVLFVLAFLGVVWWVFRPATQARWKSDAMMPLDDETPVERRTPPKDDA